MTEIQLILIAPAIACILIGIVLVTADSFTRREEHKKACRRAARRTRMY